MKSQVNTKMKQPGFYLAFFVIACIGVYLRLDQFGLQVLLDDEWHVVHQLLLKTPAEMLNTFGESDYSIPLAMLYWVELKLFGLSEFAMRWPMLLAGIAVLLALPSYIHKYFDDRVTLLFLFLLAISPRLIIYSRTARPYALTLLFSLLALAAFQRFVESKKAWLAPAAVYVICALLSAWLHLISLPLVIAPFIVHGITALRRGDVETLRRIFLLGLVTLAGLLVLLLPPLLANPQALAVKLGVQAPDFQTYYGLLFAWLGSASAVVVLIGVFFAVLGVGQLWQQLPVSKVLLAGLGLTLLVIVLSQPAWVHQPVTLARYLLPAIPLFLLAVAIGISRCSDSLVARWGRPGKYAALLAIVSYLCLTGFDSPLREILRRPNSNSLHSVFQFDFRLQKNRVYQYQKDFPLSPFWQRLATLPRDSLKIAAAPFSFETHHWDAARWERVSRQRVMPAFLNGFCTAFRWGEVPQEKGFEFKNAGYLSDQDDLIRRGFDLVVYQKPFKVVTNQGEKEIGVDTTGCESKLRKSYSRPVYEDEWLIVFPLTDSIREQFDAMP